MKVANIKHEAGKATVQNDLEVDGTLRVEGATTLVGAVAITGALTAAAGVQSAAVAVVATVGGLTTGIIPAGARFVAVTSSNADFIVTLPTAAPVGTTIDGWVGANGHEIRTTALSNETINAVDADGGAAEAAIPATTLWRAEKVSATAWILVAWDELGAAIAAIVPDAV